jgi:holo-[acyl-carrier protein] synthase
MGVVNLDSGRPTLRLTGGAARQLGRVTPSGYEPQVHLALTDDFPMAHAVVVISGVATGGGAGGGNGNSA